MDKNYLEKHNLLEARDRFQHILEYIDTRSSYAIDEEGDDEMESELGGDPNTMGGAPAGPEMGDNPNAMGGAPAGPEMGDTQMPQGLAPQGEGQEQLGATSDTDPNAEAEDEEVIDVDDLTNSQEATEEKIDALSNKFEQLMTAIDDFESRIDASNERMENLKAEIEKRNPTPVEKMTLRSTKSAPFSETPEEWWDKHAPENYSPEDDNNGAHDPQYQITKSDIDNVNDWRAISKTFDDERMSLKDMFGY